MFTATIAVGKAYTTTQGFLPHNMCPPPGYDSVVGEVSGQRKKMPREGEFSFVVGGGGEGGCSQSVMSILHAFLLERGIGSYIQMKIRQPERPKVVGEGRSR